MVFCATCANAMRTALLLRNLGFHAIPLHGQMSQNKRLASLNKFRAKNRSILISTDVASRYHHNINFDLHITLARFGITF